MIREFPLHQFDTQSFFVEIHRHNPQWRALFQKTREHLFTSEAIRTHVLDIHHVGSTAIAGLDAKPIIDLLLDVPSIEAADSIIPHLEQFGYEHLPQQREYDQRRFLRQGPNECDNWSAVRQPVAHSPEQSANQLSVAQYHCVEEARVRHEAHEGQHDNYAGRPIKQAFEQ